MNSLHQLRLKSQLPLAPFTFISQSENISSMPIEFYPISYQFQRLFLYEVGKSSHYPFNNQPSVPDPQHTYHNLAFATGMEPAF